MKCPSSSAQICLFILWYTMLCYGDYFTSAQAGDFGQVDGPQQMTEETGITADVTSSIETVSTGSDQTAFLGGQEITHGSQGDTTTEPPPQTVSVEIVTMDENNNLVMATETATLKYNFTQHGTEIAASIGTTERIFAGAVSQLQAGTDEAILQTKGKTVFSTIATSVNYGATSEEINTVTEKNIFPLTSSYSHSTVNSAFTAVWSENENGRNSGKTLGTPGTLLPSYSSPTAVPSTPCKTQTAPTKIKSNESKDGNIISFMEQSMQPVLGSQSVVIDVELMSANTDSESMILSDATSKHGSDIQNFFLQEGTPSAHQFMSDSVMRKSDASFHSSLNSIQIGDSDFDDFINLLSTDCCSETSEAVSTDIITSRKQVSSQVEKTLTESKMIPISLFFSSSELSHVTQLVSSVSQKRNEKVIYNYPDGLFMPHFVHEPEPKVSSETFSHESQGSLVEFSDKLLSKSLSEVGTHFSLSGLMTSSHGASIFLDRPSTSEVLSSVSGSYTDLSVEVIKTTPVLFSATEHVAISKKTLVESTGVTVLSMSEQSQSNSISVATREMPTNISQSSQSATFSKRNVTLFSEYWNPPGLLSSTDNKFHGSQDLDAFSLHSIETTTSFHTFSKYAEFSMDVNSQIEERKGKNNGTSTTSAETVRDFNQISQHLSTAFQEESSGGGNKSLGMTLSPPVSPESGPNDLGLTTVVDHNNMATTVYRSAVDNFRSPVSDPVVFGQQTSLPVRLDLEEESPEVKPAASESKLASFKTFTTPFSTAAIQSVAEITTRSVHSELMSQENEEGNNDYKKTLSMDSAIKVMISSSVTPDISKLISTSLPVTTSSSILPHSSDSMLPHLEDFDIIFKKSSPVYNQISSASESYWSVATVAESISSFHTAREILHDVPETDESSMIQSAPKSSLFKALSGFDVISQSTESRLSTFGAGRVSLPSTILPSLSGLEQSDLQSSETKTGFLDSHYTGSLRIPIMKVSSNFEKGSTASYTHPISLMEHDFYTFLASRSRALKSGQSTTVQLLEPSHLEAIGISTTAMNNSASTILFHSTGMSLFESDVTLHHLNSLHQSHVSSRDTAYSTSTLEGSVSSSDLISSLPMQTVESVSTQSILTVSSDSFTEKFTSVPIHSAKLIDTPSVVRSEAGSFHTEIEHGSLTSSWIPDFHHVSNTISDLVLSSLKFTASETISAQRTETGSESISGTPYVPITESVFVNTSKLPDATQTNTAPVYYTTQLKFTEEMPHNISMDTVRYISSSDSLSDLPVEGMHSNEKSSPLLSSSVSDNYIVSSLSVLPGFSSVIGDNNDLLSPLKSTSSFVQEYTSSSVQPSGSLFSNVLPSSTSNLFVGEAGSTPTLFLSSGSVLLTTWPADIVHQSTLEDSTQEVESIQNASITKSSVISMEISQSFNNLTKVNLPLSGSKVESLDNSVPFLSDITSSSSLLFSSSSSSSSIYNILFTGTIVDGRSSSDSHVSSISVLDIISAPSMSTDLAPAQSDGLRDASVNANSNEGTLSHTSSVLKYDTTSMVSSDELSSEAVVVALSRSNDLNYSSLHHYSSSMLSDVSSTTSQSTSLSASSNASTSEGTLDDLSTSSASEVITVFGSSYVSPVIPPSKPSEVSVISPVISSENLGHSEIMSVTSVFDFSSESSMNSVLDSVKQGTSFSPLAPSSEELYDLSSSLNLIDGAEISKGVVLPSASDFTIYLTSSEQHSPTLLVDVFGYFATVISSSSTAEVFKSTSVLTERISLSATTLISAEILGGTLATLEAPESSATGTSLTTVSAIPNTGSPSTTPPAVIVTMSPEAEENRMVLTLHIPFTEMVLEGEKLIREIEKGLVISYHLAVKKVNHSRSKRQAGLGTSQDVEVHITEVKNATNSNYNDLVDVIFYMTKNGSVMKSDHIEKTFNKLSNSELSLKVGYAVETGVRPLVTRKENPTTRPSWLIAAISVPVLLVIILLLVSVYLWKNMTCGAEDHVERGPKESLEMHNLGVDVERGAIVQIGRNGKSLPLLDTPSVSPMKPPKMKNEEKEKNLCNSDTIEHEHRMMRSREISNVSGRSSKGKQKRRILEVETDESDRESQTSSASSREGESDRELSRQETKEVNRASHSKTAKSRKKSKGKRRLPPLRPKKSSKVAPLVVKSALTTSHESLTSDAGNMDEEAEVHEAAVFENIAKLSRIEEPPPAKPDRPPVRFKNIITPAPGPALTAYLSSLPPLDIQEEEEDTVATDKKESKTGIPIKLVDPFREEEQNGSDPDITLKEKAAIERMKNKQRHREKAKQEEKKKRRSKKTKEERQAWDKAQSQIEAVLQSDDPPTVPHKKQHDTKSQRQNQSSEDEEEMEERKPTRNMRAGHKKQPRQETEYSSRPFLTKPPAHDAWQANSELPGFTRVAATPAQQKELMKKQHSLLAKQQMQREQHEYKKSLEEHARQLINETLVQQDLETENDDSGSDKVTSKADRSKMPIHKPQEHEDSAVETILKEGRILHSRETPRRNADSSPFSRENTKDSVNRLNRKESSFDMTLKEDLRKVIQDELRSLNR